MPANKEQGPVMRPRSPAWGLWTLLAACGSPPVVLPPLPAPPPPPLPATARQAPPGLICSPTCSAAWQKLVDNELQRLTLPASPASSASSGTTR